MKKFIFLLMCFFCCFNSPLKANEDLIDILNFAVECKDIKLVKEVIESLLKMESNSKNLLDALAKYSEQGNINFALHNAIKDKNLLASVILVNHTKDLNTRKGTEYCNCVSTGQRDQKNPIELAFEADMIGIIPYLLMKNANPYGLRKVTFVYEEEENIDYLNEFRYVAKNHPTTKKVVVETHNFSRNIIADIIIHNRFDVIELLEKTAIDWNKPCCMIWGKNYTPLQFSLATRRYEIAQLLIDYGVRIE
jgi:DNA polymerase III epsilon subunit-like protein